MLSYKIYKANKYSLYLGIILGEAQRSVVKYNVRLRSTSKTYRNLFISRYDEFLVFHLQINLKQSS